MAVSDNDTASCHFPLGIPTKVLDLLGQYVDLQAPITALFMNAAVPSAIDSGELDILKGISALICNGVKGDWQQLRPSQILAAFPSVCITLEKILPTIVPMKKWYYLISSAPQISKSKTVSVTVGLVKGTTDKNLKVLADHIKPKTFRGVSSGYLVDL